MFQSIFPGILKILFKHQCLRRKRIQTWFIFSLGWNIFSSFSWVRKAFPTLDVSQRRYFHACPKKNLYTHADKPPFDPGGVEWYICYVFPVTLIQLF